MDRDRLSILDTGAGMREPLRLLLGLVAFWLVGLSCVHLSEDIQVGWEALPSLPDASPQRHWEDTASPNDLAVDSRELELTFRDDTVQGEYRVRAALSAPLTQRFLAAKDLRTDDTMADGLLGGVTITDRPALDVALSPWQGALFFHASRADVANGVATLVWRSDPLRVSFGRRSVQLGPTARAVVKGDDMVRLSGWGKVTQPQGLAVVSSSGGSVLLRRTASSAGFSSEDASVGYLDVPRWLGGSAVPFADPALGTGFTLVYALITLAALRVARRGVTSSDDEIHLRGTLRMQITLEIVFAVSSVAFVVSDTYSNYGNDIYPWAVPLIVAAPLLPVLWFTRGSAPPLSRGVGMTVGIAAAGLVALALWITENGLDVALLGGLAWQPRDVVLTAGILAGASVVAAWAVRSRRPVVLGVLFAALALPLAYWWPRFAYTDLPDGRYNGIGRWAYVCICIALALSLAVWAYRFVVNLLPGRSSRRIPVVVAVVCVAATGAILVPAAVLVAHVSEPARGIVRIQDVAPVLDNLVAMLDWALLAALTVLVVERMGAARPFRAVRPLLLVAFPLVVYPNNGFAYIPTTALLGVLAAHALLRPADSVEAAPVDTTVMADVGFSGARDQLGRLRLERPENDVGVSLPTADTLPAPSVRLRYGAAVGLVLGLPLNGAYVLSGDRSWTSGDFLLLDFVNGPLWTLFFWTFLGGFVSLCWPFLRGGGPVSKALGVWVAVNVADLPADVVWNNSPDWISRGVAAAETLAFLLVLCVIVDVRMSVPARSTMAETWRLRGSRWFASGALLAVLLTGIATTYANSLASELGKTTVNSVIPNSSSSKGTNTSTP